MSAALATGASTALSAPCEVLRMCVSPTAARRTVCCSLISVLGPDGANPIPTQHRPGELDPSARAFYARTLTSLDAAGVEFLVGGAYALERYTGVERHTKDLDVFVRRSDLDTTLEMLASAGCRTELPYPHWLGKAHCDDNF